MISPDIHFNELETYLPVYHKNQTGLRIPFSFERKDPDLGIGLRFHRKRLPMIGSGHGE